MNPIQMKPIVYLAGAGLVGAVVGIVAMQVTRSSDRNESAEPAAVAEATTPGSRSEAGGESRGGDPRSPNRLLRDLAERNGSPEAVDAVESEERADEVRNAMRERQMERFTSQAAKWSAALGLDAGQQERLLDIAGGQLDELEKLAVEGMDSGDPATVSESARRAMEILSGQAMESSLAEMLTPDQRQAYEEFSNRQNVSRAESRALRQLAGINEELMLTPEQRNQVYAIYYDDAMAELGSKDPLQATIDNLAASAGVSVDPAMQKMISSLAERGLAELGSGRQIDPEAVEAMARETIEQSLGVEVERLRGVLNDAQLEIYRKQLRSQMETLTGGRLSE